MKKEPVACPSVHVAQHGAVTLLVTLGLVVLATLASFYSARSMLVEQLTTHNLAHAHQARLAAQAALATAQAAFQAPNDPLMQMHSGSTCPAGLSPPQWQCSALDLEPHPGLPQARLTATAVRDLVTAPHQVTLYAQATLASPNSQAQVRESLWMPALSPAPENAPTAALVLHGCVSEAAGSRLQICPLDPNNPSCRGHTNASAVYTHWINDRDGNGQISPTETNACLALTSSSLPAGGSVSGSSQSRVRNPCNRAAWRSVLGEITDAQLQAWSAAQAQNGLHAHSTPPRTIYWIDSPADWTQNVGSAEHPVLLAFSSRACAQRCPRLASGVHVYGSVLLDAGCNDEKMRGWSAGTITGQLVVESGLPEWQSGQVWASPKGRQAYILDWPKGIDTAHVQRVPGSWSDAAP